MLCLLTSHNKEEVLINLNSVRVISTIKSVEGPGTKIEFVHGNDLWVWESLTDIENLQIAFRR